MEGSVSPRSNKLLAQLSEPMYRRVRGCLEYQENRPGESLTQEGRHTRYVHFPVSGAIARMIYDEDGGSSEFGVCGNEGAIGLSGLAGANPAYALGTSLLVVKSATYRCEAKEIDRELADAEFRSIVIRYFRYVLSEAMLTAFCNKHHNLEQQLCRLILMVTDRTSTMEIRTTHQVMALLLGARREGITEVVGRLRSHHVLEANRGTLRVTDRNALLKYTCKCYYRLQDRYRLLVTELTTLPVRG